MLGYSRYISKNQNQQVLEIEKAIQFTLYFQGKAYLINTYDHEFYDLRELIMQQLDLDYFGECGGVGRCVTCLVSISKDNDTEEEAEEFACQIKIERALARSIIRIVGDRLKEF